MFRFYNDNVVNSSKQQHEKTLQQLSIVITTNFWHITSAMWHCLELLVEATEVML
jgi:hypothetical protein